MHDAELIAELAEFLDECIGVSRLARTRSSCEQHALPVSADRYFAAVRPCAERDLMTNHRIQKTKIGIKQLVDQFFHPFAGLVSGDKVDALLQRIESVIDGNRAFGDR